MITVPMTVAVSNVQVPMTVSVQPEIAMSVGMKYEVNTHETYHGEYEFTPAEEPQVIEAADKIMERNIVINPIPSNYGRISYNGAVLTVS